MQTQPKSVVPKPNYDERCVVCDQSPVVDLYDPENPDEDIPYHKTDLCGPCCFGTASAIDPDTW